MNPEGFDRMNLSRRSLSPDTAAFSLVEILVATAVLAIFLMIGTQLTFHVARATRHGQEVSENYSAGRAVLDIIARDLDGILYRDDLAAFPANAASDGQLAFYTKVAGLGETGSTIPMRRLSLVSYRFYTESTATSSAWLGRSDLGITWDQGDRISFGTTVNLPQLSQAKQRRLCDSMVGFDFVFLLADGTTTRVPDPDLARVRAVRVTLALLDANSYRILQQSGQDQELIDFLKPRIPTGSGSTKHAWESALESEHFWIRLPQDVRSRLKIYERTIPLPYHS